MDTYYLLNIQDQTKYRNRWEEFKEGGKLHNALLGYDGGAYGRDSLEHNNKYYKEKGNLKLVRENHPPEDLLWMALEDPDMGWKLKGGLIDKLQPLDQIYANVLDADTDVGKAIINHMCWGTAMTYMGKQYIVTGDEIICTLWFVFDDDAKLTHRTNYLYSQNK